jgi:hypothetical protein
VVVAALIAAVAVVVTLASLRQSETDVYRTALAQYANDHSVLASAPSSCQIESTGHPAFRSLDPGLVSSFLAANAAGTTPISLEALREYFAIADSDTLAAYQRAGVSSAVLLPGERTLVRLSRVGFNRDKSEALFCLESRSGVLIHLKQQSGSWQQVSTTDVWIS